MKIRSESEFQDKIDTDISQLRKDILNLKGLLLNSKNKNELLLAKCLVVLSYSHWEGFVKNATKYYLMLIKFRGDSQDKYSREFRSSLFYRQIMKNTDSVVNKIVLTEDCLYNNRSLVIDEGDLSDTESNLDFKTLKKILFNVGLRSSVFDTKEMYINEIVGDRNTFAHGELQPYTVSDAIDIADTVLELMDYYKTEIENAVSLKRYLHP